MKTYTLILIVLLLAGCRADRIDISKLNSHDQALFTLAAEREGVEVTLNGTLGDWTVNYDPNISRLGEARTNKNLGAITNCHISINPVLEACSNGGVDQQFFTTARHELRHCQGSGHSDNPENLMYPMAPCWPVD